MSSGIDYTLLYSGGSSSSGVASNILSILSQSPPSTGGIASTGNPLIDLKLAQQNQVKATARQAKDPAVVRDLAGFTKGVAIAKDAATALRNPNVLKVLLTANGLGDQARYPALATKILLSNPADPNALVNRITDTRWKTVVKTYSLATKGLAGLTDRAVQSQLASAYASVTWLTALNQTTPGLASALTFLKQASAITKVDQILGDPVNRDVVLTALGIPPQIAYQSLTSQEQAVASRIDITQLQNPAFVRKLTDEYLLGKQQATQATTAPSLDALANQARGLVV